MFMLLAIWFVHSARIGEKIKGIPFSFKENIDLCR